MIRKKQTTKSPQKDKVTEELPLFAALDLGTNNCRLLIARPLSYPTREDHGIKVIDTFSRIVRLGEGLGHNNLLLPEAMERTIVALKQCKQKIERFDLPYYRFVSTEACRRAENTMEFLGKVHRETGLEIEVISNEEEAKLAFLGCSTLLEPVTEYALVFDIGGGSTEIMLIQRDYASPPEMLCDYRIKDWLSLDQGVMNLSEKYCGAGYAEQYFDEIIGDIVAKLRVFDKKNHIGDLLKSHQVQLLSTSGTLTTLAAIHLELSHYERSRIDGYAFETNDLRDAVEKILAMTPKQRFNNPCIGAERSDYVISGCALFEAVCTLWPISQVTIADRGVREGIILSLMQEYVRKNS